MFYPQLTLVKAVENIRACETSSSIAVKMSAEAVNRLTVEKFRSPRGMASDEVQQTSLNSVGVADRSQIVSGALAIMHASLSSLRESARNVAGPTILRKFDTAKKILLVWITT